MQGPPSGSIGIGSDGASYRIDTFDYTPSEAARMAAFNGGPTTETITVTVTDGDGAVGAAGTVKVIPLAPNGV